MAIHMLDSRAIQHSESPVNRLLNRHVYSDCQLLFLEVDSELGLDSDNISLESKYTENPEYICHSTCSSFMMPRQPRWNVRVKNLVSDV
jgi:hypothetical protein